MKENRYCFICDNKIKKRKIDGILRNVCISCQKITSGYRKEEEYFVKELREYFSQSAYYMIEPIILILRDYLKRKNKIYKKTNNLKAGI